MRGFARAQRREEEELERKKNAYQEGAGLKWVVGKHCGVFAIEGVLALHERGALAYAARPEKGRGKLHTWEEKQGNYLRMTFY